MPHSKARAGMVFAYAKIRVPIQIILFSKIFSFLCDSSIDTLRVGR